jgi:hypothetical protein
MPGGQLPVQDAAGSEYEDLLRALHKDFLHQCGRTRTAQNGHIDPQVVVLISKPIDRDRNPHMQTTDFFKCRHRLQDFDDFGLKRNQDCFWKPVNGLAMQSGVRIASDLLSKVSIILTCVPPVCIKIDSARTDF